MGRAKTISSKDPIECLHFLSLSFYKCSPLPGAGGCNTPFATKVNFNYQQPGPGDDDTDGMVIANAPYCAPSTVPSVVTWGHYYHPHFRDEETKAQRG